MRNSLFLALSALLLAGCATASYTYWLPPPGGSEQQFRQDEYACMQEAQQQSSNAYVNPYGGAAQSGSNLNIDLYSACLRARGYKQGRRDAAGNVVLDDRYN